MRTILSIAATLALAAAGRADVKSETIKYKAGDAECVGYLAWDDSIPGKRPGVVIFHEWWGLNDYSKKRAEMLAKAGYAAFCADLYGDGKTAEHPDDAAKFMNHVMKNEALWLSRADAALKTLAAQPQVDSSKLAAIGYCFGGTTAIVLAASGADVKAVATFHAGIPDVTADQARKIKARMLICHGEADGFIPKEKITAFRSALDAAKTNYDFVAYPGAVHGFTVEGAEKRGVPGLKYDANADKQSWDSMLKLFQEALK